MALDYVTYCTAEGDRIILELQCARFLVKVRASLFVSLQAARQWCKSRSEWRCPDIGCACVFFACGELAFVWMRLRGACECPPSLLSPPHVVVMLRSPAVVWL